MLGTGAWVLTRPASADQDAEDFKVSLNELSLRRTLAAGQMNHLDLAKTARREFDIESIEYASQFFRQRVEDEEYLMEMNKRAADHGVRQILIMVDGEGRLGDPHTELRNAAVRNHHKWIHAARKLGCHAIEVDTTSTGTPAEQLNHVAEGIRVLCEYAEPHHIYILVGCRNRQAANAGWLLRVIQQVDHPACAALPTFPSLAASIVTDDIARLVPRTKGVCATAQDFDSEGRETHIDFLRIMSVLVEAGYRGYVSIAYQGDRLPEPDGIRATKALLEAAQSALRTS